MTFQSYRCAFCTFCTRYFHPYKRLLHEVRSATWVCTCKRFCWHDEFKAFLAWHYTYHHLQQSSTPMFHSPSSVLPEIVTKVLVSFLCLLISAKSYPLISYSCDLPARQLICVLGSPAYPPTLIRSSELAMLLLCITHTSPLSLRDC